MIRYPAVAGQFYPANREELTSFMESVCHKDKNRVKAKAVIVPHAGYIYSGAVAASVFERVKIPSTNVIMGPNHTGLGKRVSVFPEGTWVTPFGEVPVNNDISSKLIQSFPFQSDVEAHMYEHSVEVEIPFLQYCSGFKDISIVPIVYSYISYDDCAIAGKVLANILKDEDSLIVISSDFSHYISSEKAKKLDSIAIDAITHLNAESLYEGVVENNITMCGFIPATIGITAAKLLGATSAEVVSYRTSGDVTGDYSKVVSYAGIIIY